MKSIKESTEKARAHSRSLIERREVHLESRERKGLTTRRTQRAHCQRLSAHIDSSEKMKWILVVHAPGVRGVVGMRLRESGRSSGSVGYLQKNNKHPFFGCAGGCSSGVPAYPGEPDAPGMRRGHALTMGPIEDRGTARGKRSRREIPSKSPHRGFKRPLSAAGGGCRPATRARTG